MSTSSTRRGFLAMAGVGAAAAAGAAAIGTRAAHSMSAPAPVEEAVLPDGAAGSLMAHVLDVRSGDISVLLDGHETVIHDPALVAKLAAHATNAAAARA